MLLRRRHLTGGARRTIATGAAVALAVTAPLALGALDRDENSPEIRPAAENTEVTEVPLLTAPDAKDVDLDSLFAAAEAVGIPGINDLRKLAEQFLGARKDGAREDGAPQEGARKDGHSHGADSGKKPAGALTNVKEITAETPFSVVAVTWHGDGPEHAFFRALQEDGSWGEWYDTHPLDAGVDANGSAKTGTEPIYVGSTKAVQIAIDGGAAAPAVTPEAAPPAPSESPRDAAPEDATPAAPAADRPTGDAPVREDAITPVSEDLGPHAVLLTPDDSPILGVNNVADNGRPPVISRASWGAGQSCKPTYDDRVNGAVVHHTTGSNKYSKTEAPGIVRAIWKYHAVNLGWCDIGYNALVDKYGQIYEGRAGGLDKNVQGAHTGGFNENTWGVSMLGDYQSTAPSNAMLDSVGKLIGWRLRVAGIDPAGKGKHVSEGTSFTFVPQGKSVTLPNIFAHRDVGNTACPGDAAYAKMGTIRRIAAESAASAPSLPTLPLPAKPGDKADDTKPAPGSKPATGSLTGLSRLADLPTDLPAVLDTVVDMVGNNAVSRLWAQLQGPVGKLGRSLGGVQRINDTVTFAKFENGAIFESPETGAHALWGAIGDEWIRQGGVESPLGLPVGEEYVLEDGRIRADFQHGSLTFDPRTGDIETVLAEGTAPAPAPEPAAAPEPAPAG